MPTNTTCAKVGAFYIARKQPLRRSYFMSRLRILTGSLLCAIFTAILTDAQSAAQKQTVPLDSGWEFRQTPESPGAAETTWRPAQVPGDVHLDLLRNNLIPDPFYRDNEARLQWIGAPVGNTAPPSRLCPLCSTTRTLTLSLRVSTRPRSLQRI